MYPTEADACLHTNKEKDLFVIVHVDDFQVMGPNTLERLLEPNNGQSSKHLIKEFNSIIGGLQYLANNTRPDIAHSVNHLARFLSNPSEEHIQAARRVLKYVAKEPDRGIVFTTGKENPVLEAYSDADFANDPTTSRSISGSLIRLSSGPICWKSRLQREVVLSTTEAEYISATETCRLLQWVKKKFLYRQSISNILN